ncbi:hypothetical protein LIA77_04229 [Sarocladium implicatum]|nr:hypothetical protein LIA77_04229 [Sarocladium implicatum]
MAVIARTSKAITRTRAGITARLYDVTGVLVMASHEYRYSARYTPGFCGLLTTGQSICVLLQIRRWTHGVAAGAADLPTSGTRRKLALVAHDAQSPTKPDNLPESE